MIKKFLIVSTLLFLAAFAQDYDPLKGFNAELGDFSSRSTIMNKMNGTSQITQNQINALKERKLAPNAQCLNEQIKKGNIENVEMLLQSGVSPNSTYLSDYPSYVAAKYKQADIVRLLVENGAKLDRGFFSELFEAVKNKDNELAFFLINNGARVNYQDSVTNNTILSMALKNKMYDVAKILIQNGAKADNLSVKIIKQKKLQWIVEEANAAR